jgi:hypothetical protein
LGHLVRRLQDKVEKFSQQTQFSGSVRKTVGNEIEVKLHLVLEHAAMERHSLSLKQIMPEALLSFSLMITNFITETIGFSNSPGKSIGKKL